MYKPDLCLNVFNLIFISMSVGPLFVDQTIPKNISVLNREYSVESGGAVEKGGWYTPPNCTPRVKVGCNIFGWN